MISNEKQNDEFTQLCKDLEHYETPKWAVDAILDKVILTEQVVDPCAGTGVLTKAALDAGYACYPLDIHDFGCPRVEIKDWLNSDIGIADLVHSNTVLMNPPFSKGCDFVEKSFERGARKVLCFQRFSWLESQTRRGFWDKYPPKTVHLCGDRATCWRHDIPDDNRKNGTTTAHAWFEFDAGYTGSTIIERIYK